MKSSAPHLRVCSAASLFFAALVASSMGPWLAAPHAEAQAATGADPQTQPPFVGVVTVDDVEVRSGAGESYYPVAVLKAGEQVKVVEDFYGWFRIEAPAGLHAFVSRRDLDRRGDGTVGVANADSTRVTIKGIDRGWNDSFRTIRTLDRGDRVEIVAPSGDEAYEILAPTGSLVFLPPGSVEPLAELPADGAPATAAPPAAATAPGDGPAGEMVPLGEALAGTSAEDLAVEAMTDPTPAPVVTESVASETGTQAPATLPPLSLNDGGPGPEDPAPAAVTPIQPPAPAVEPSERVAAVEEAQLPRFSLPLDEQPLDEMQAAYQGLADAGGLRPFEDRIVRSRLRAVQRNRQFKAAIDQIQRRQDELVAVEPTRIDPEPDAPYIAVGVLRTSTVFAGEEAGVALPRMFRVIDPATERTIAYLRPARGLDPVALLGQLVGVRGTKEIDATLGTPLVTAQDVVALDAVN